MKILIYGLPKSGTSAIFSLIKSSQVEECVFLFEPDNLTLCNEINTKHLLVKTLVGQRNEALFDQFEKKILIIRDPRDWLISTFLYTTAIHTIFKNNGWVSALLRLLSKKQEDTSSISFHELISYKVKNHSPWIDNLLLSDVVFKNYINFHKANPDYFVLKYEDFINRDLAELEQYLGLKLTGSTNVGEELKRVERTKSYGDWKQWFTIKDVDYYKPILKEFMDRYGYTDWELPSNQKVSSAHGSTYVLRLVSEARKNEPSSFTKKTGIISFFDINFDWISYLLNNPSLISEGIYTKWGAIIHWILSRCLKGRSSYRNNII